MDRDQIVVAILTALFWPMVLFFLYLTFVILPVSFWADAECLSKGYPNSHVTIGLQRYCSTLDGSVTVKVEKLRGEGE